jgi:hypothetical protein
MSVLVDCPACTRKLRVPDELLGARVKCPTCGGLFDAARDSARSSEVPKGLEVSAPSAPALPASDEPSPAAPPLEPAGEQAIPPIPAAQIKLTLDEQGPPRRASDRPAPPLARRPRGPDYDEDDDDRPWEASRYGVPRDCEPHRGGLVLALGIISIVLGFTWFLSVVGLALGIVAWVMGHRDLRKIEARAMDPQGRGMTQGGWICGIIGTALSGLYSLFCIGWLGFWLAMLSAAATTTTTTTPASAPAVAPVQDKQGMKKVQPKDAQPPMRDKDDRPR